MRLYFQKIRKPDELDLFPAHPAYLVYNFLSLVSSARRRPPLTLESQGRLHTHYAPALSMRRGLAGLLTFVFNGPLRRQVYGRRALLLKTLTAIPARNRPWFRQPQ